MTVSELMNKLQSLLHAGKIDEDDVIVVRNPDISAGAMEAGSDGYHEVEEVLAPGDERVVLLGEEF